MKRAWCFALFLGACSTRCSTPSSPGPVEPSAASPDASAEAAAVAPDVELIASFDLPKSGATQAISALWFEDQTRTLHALQDNAPNIVSLVGSDDLHAWTVGRPIALTGRPPAEWDGEGLTRAGDAWLVVSNETTPLIERFDLAGKYLGAIDVPAHFTNQASNNKGFESLTIPPSGRFLFSANESALTIDGAAATRSKGTTVRIWRRDLTSKSADEERAYRTDPLGKGTGGDMGISDMAALSEETLLVLERGFQAGFGNTVRLFRVDFGAGPNVLGAAALPADAPVLEKKLIVDLATLPSDGITNPSPQPNPILDNYEAIALGPVQADGRRVVFLATDDNAQSSQVARVLVLALRLP